MAQRRAGSRGPGAGGGSETKRPKGGADARPVEVELKYVVDDRAVAEHLLEAPNVGPFHGGTPERAIQVEDRYVDSADGGLARAGFAARLRQGATGVVVGVKSTHVLDGALQRREELEGPADRSLDPHAWPPSPARSLVLELCGDAPLVELVTVRQLRRRRQLDADGTTAELSVDEVDVVARGRVVERFTELEVELQRGDESALEALRTLLETEAGLAPSRRSKFERALLAARMAGARVPAMAASGQDGAGGTADDRAGGERSDPDPVASEAHGESASAAPQDDTAARRHGARSTRRGSDPGSRVSYRRGKAVRGRSVSSGDFDGRSNTVASGTTGTSPASDSKGPKPEAGGAAAASDDGAAAASDDGAAAVANQTNDASRSAPHEGGSAATATTPGSTAQAAPRLATGKTPGVFADDTLAEAGRKVLRFHLARMLAREAGTRDGADLEELHSMRVATRRMRAAWRVFGDAYRLNRTRRFRRQLREIGGRLGAVRDRDVLIEGLVAYAKGLAEPEASGIEPLIAAWRSERDAARELLIAELDSDRYRRFVDEFVDFTGREGVGVEPLSPTQPHRIRDTAPSRIWAAYEEVRAFEAVLRWADVPTLHQLRIAGKRLRYSLEFVRETLTPEAATLIERVVALQDHLGALNDADVASSLARSFLVEHATRLSEAEEQAIGRYLSSREAEMQRLRRTIGPTWRRVAGLTFRRALGRVTAAL